MKHILRRALAIGVLAAMAFAVVATNSPVAHAADTPQDVPASVDPASRFFVGDTLTFVGLSSTNSFAINPSPGESVTALHADFIATADSTDVLIDSFVDGRLIDSQKLDAATTTVVTLSLGEIVSSAEVSVRVTHANDSCRSDDTRLVELVDVEFSVDGLPLRPVGPQDFFPPHLSRVAVAMEKPNNGESQAAALDTMSRIAARYRRNDFVIELVSVADLEFLQADERAVIIDADDNLLDDPKLSSYGPKVLRIHPVAGVDHLTSMLELSAPPTQDSDIYVRVGDLSRDLSAQGITTAEVKIDVPQTVFSRIPDSYDVHLGGWTSMAHTSDFGAQILTVTADDHVVFTKTVTDSGPFDAVFSIAEPPRDLELRVTLRGPAVSESCEIESAAMEVSVDALSSIAPIGQRSDYGFGSLPQGFQGVYSIDASGDAWPRAARLMTLAQRPSATALTVTNDGPVISVKVTNSDTATLRYIDGGLHLDGSLQQIDRLLDLIAEVSWYALEGDIVQLGGTGLVAQFAEPEPLVFDGTAPERVLSVLDHNFCECVRSQRALAPLVASQNTSYTPELSDASGDRDFTDPPGALAYADEDLESELLRGSPSDDDLVMFDDDIDKRAIGASNRSEDGLIGRVDPLGATKGKRIPWTAIIGAAVVTLAGGIAVNRRDELLGR